MLEGTLVHGRGRGDGVGEGWERGMLHEVVVDESLMDESPLSETLLKDESWVGVREGMETIFCFGVSFV